MSLNLQRVVYSKLNSRQKENYNFQKVSAALADFGFITIRLSDDWNGADFIAYHNNGADFFKVQLKGRLFVDTKYKDKDIWGCFHYRGVWYLYPHDDFLKWVLKNTGIAKTKGWLHTNNWAKLTGGYSWPSPNQDILQWLSAYAIK